MTTPAKRPPAERGQGRKSVSGAAGKSPVLQIVVSPELKNKVMSRGMDWARQVLEKAE
jgi:hypothetical protein